MLKIFKVIDQIHSFILLAKPGDRFIRTIIHCDCMFDGGFLYQYVRYSCFLFSNKVHNIYRKFLLFFVFFLYIGIQIYQSIKSEFSSFSESGSSTYFHHLKYPYILSFSIPPYSSFLFRLFLHSQNAKIVTETENGSN